MRAPARTAAGLIEQWIASPLGVFPFFWAACCFCFVASQWACVFWGGIYMRVGGKCASFWTYVRVCISGDGLQLQRILLYACQALEQLGIENRCFSSNLASGNSSLIDEQNDSSRPCSMSCTTMCQLCSTKLLTDWRSRNISVQIPDIPLTVNYDELILMLIIFATTPEAWGSKPLHHLFFAWPALSRLRTEEWPGDEHKDCCGVGQVPLQHLAIWTLHPPRAVMDAPFPL